MAEPFQYRVRRLDGQIVEVHYAGHMKASDTQHLVETEALVMKARSPVGLYYEVPTMSGFDRGQVQIHASAFLRMGKRVLGIAVMGARPAIRFGAVTVSLLARLRLKTFDERAPALAWLQALQTLPPHS